MFYALYYDSRFFVKSLGNTHRTHSEYDRSVYWLAFHLYANFIDFEDPVIICLKIFNLLDEAKCHAVCKMIMIIFTVHIEREV